jgi:thiamine biosynthesis lipoprotein
MAYGSSYRFEALGTTAQVVVADPAALGDAVAILRGRLAAIDAACSRFREDSELVALNRSAGRARIASPLLFDALLVALRAAALTGGDVDPTVCPALRALGWDRDFAFVVRREGPSICIVPAGGWWTVRVNPATREVQMPRGVELDLGATAKAFAADLSACAIARTTGGAVLVDLGGDVAVAGSPQPEQGWPVRVCEDHRDPQSGVPETVAVAVGGLATSSTGGRRWRAGGAELHHIVDPRSGLPAREVWRSVTVAAATCVDANTASTAAIVRGEDAPAWLERAGLPARLVRPDGSVVRTAAWPRAAA